MDQYGIDNSMLSYDDMLLLECASFTIGTQYDTLYKHTPCAEYHLGRGRPSSRICKTYHLLHDNDYINFGTVDFTNLRTRARRKRRPAEW